jgi:HTH-type transcriptional regulator/antitoxin HigA
MNASIDIDRLIPAWQDLRAEAPIGHIESAADYERVTSILNRLLDVVRDDSAHPLYSLVTLIGDLLEAYEANLEPLDQ